MSDRQPITILRSEYSELRRAERKYRELMAASLEFVDACEMQEAGFGPQFDVIEASIEFQLAVRRIVEGAD